MVLAMPDEPPDPGANGVFVVAVGEDTRDAAMALLSELRREGFKAQMEFGARGVKAQMKRADRLGATHTIIVGGDELARGEVTVKDMGSGEQTAVPRSDIARFLTAGVRPQAQQP
jgi:histidyl-tRNA synthetase